MTTIHQEPPLAEQQAILTERIAQLRRQGYAHSIEALAVAAQTPSSEEERKQVNKMISDLRQASANAYAAARRLQELLDALPADEPPTAPNTVPSEQRTS